MNNTQTAPEPEQIKAMDPDELLEQYDKLIWKTVNRYGSIVNKYGWIDKNDVYQAASMAMLKAQETFSEDKESGFIHYAVLMMKWAIIRFLKDEKVDQEPIILSLDEPITKDSSVTRGEMMPSDDIPLIEQAEAEETSARVREAVHALPDDQEEVVERLYLNDPTETRVQIANDKGVDPQDIVNQKEKAFRQLRHKLRSLRPEIPRHIGLSSFNTRWTSEPEEYVLNLERKQERTDEKKGLNTQ